MKNIVFLSGGLGNQMFSFAYAQMMREHGYEVACDWGLLRNGNEHNGYELERVFEGIESRCTRWMPFVLRVCYVLTYVLKMSALTSVLKLFGWEYVTDEKGMKTSSANYNHMLCGFMWNRDFLPMRYRFRFREDSLNEETKRLAVQMSRENSVSIHIRRGDYLSAHYGWLYKDICTDRYYRNAIAYIRDQVTEPVFYVFSNDVEWVRENFRDIQLVVVDCNHGTDSWQDMYLMSKCKHNIVANSTFSWWGAYLNENPEKIIVRPSRFDNDNRAYNIFPEEWVIANS